MTDELNKTCLRCNAGVTIFGEKFFDTRFGLDRTFSIGRCNTCGLEQIVPMPKHDEVKRLYEQLYNFSSERNTTYTRFRERFLRSPLYRLWLVIDGDISFHSKKGLGRLLDIGCNEGRGLTLYRHNGFDTEGLELNSEAASMARSRGFTVHADLLENFQPRDAYDIAILSNVLEHSLNPKTMLFHVQRILKLGGQLWISCPNNQSWFRYLFGRFWINWHVPFHIAHFSGSSLRTLLEESGFEILKIKQKTPALWVVYSIIARLFAKRGKPTAQLRNPLLVMGFMMIVRGILFPLLWIGNFSGHGDCIVITARKK